MATLCRRVKGLLSFPALILLLSFILLSSSVGIVFAQGITVDFFPQYSANVTSYFPEGNYPDPDTLNIGFTKVDKFAFLFFDISKIPTSTHILTATLSAYTESGTGDEEAVIDVYTPKDIWCSDTLSWNTKPTISKSATSAAVSLDQKWNNWDITGVVSSWIDGSRDNTGVALGSDHAVFTRRFSGIGKETKPKLSITFSENDTEIASLAATQRNENKISDSPKQPCILAKKDDTQTMTALRRFGGIARRQQKLLLGVSITFLVAFYGVLQVSSRKRRRF